MSKSNQIWSFFSSVKLAIFTISTIALTSVIGTLVLQQKPDDYYISRYGEATARFFQILDIPDMYGSWWFLGLLGLLCVNLIICSIDRFPAVWKQITMDQTSFKVDRLRKMAFAESIPTSTHLSHDDTISLLKKRGYNVTRKETDNGYLVAGQKGGWSRTGVYVVHLSILVIFLGAIVGHFTGFKGSVMIPETKKTARIFNSKSSEAIDLGFEVRCDLFEIEFYDNGMPKEYLSRLTILEDGKEILSKDIEVNAPLKHRGITFYQSSYEGYRDFIITFADGSGKMVKQFPAPFQQQVEWNEKGLVFGVVNAEAIRDRVVRMKLWIKSDANEPVVQWLKNGEEMTFDLNGSPVTITTKQMYATGLQVAKDPGVWIVYLGCLLMMAGLYAAFFLSHRRVWIFFSKDNSETLLLSGTANKNKIGFEKSFQELKAAIRKEIN
ncbi:cytochrome c biogenesis protein ResB [Desulfopila sp. IMCC35008]|uniref:cytochrome c biogenesis protein ResB n=1 Tax=Desulfopila sp. IMCC35008 TaxID=2653858 RepID=UPI0013CFFFA1|nr:cytochrome c biogenesis protein ResB [Desulfopila sp. IMCC35008]